MATLPLSPGARVGVFAPSGIPDPDRMDVGWRRVRGWGLDLVPAPHLGDRHRYLAGTDDDRLADLVWALSDPSLDAAWLARGGYGLLRLLPRIPWDRLPERPVFGFSDATALFSAFHRRGRRGGVHAPVLNSLGDLPDAESLEALRRLVTLGEAPVLGGIPVRSGHARGPLVGGNLCTLASLAGTPDALLARGCIVLLEEVTEPPYRVDRLAAQLLASGALDGARAIAIGSLVQCDAPEGADWSPTDVLVDLLEPLGVPILTGVPVGHASRNLPFVHGAEAVLDGAEIRFIPPG